MFELTYVLPARRATDSSGNWLAYDYRRVGGPTPLIGLSPVKSTSSDGRLVDFIYNEATQRLETMQYNIGRVWRYAQSDADVGNLASVTLPADRVWRYSYAPGALGGGSELETAKARKLQTLTCPEGGTVTFDIEPFKYSWNYPNSPANPSEDKGERVRQRTLSTGGTWT